MEQNVIVNKWKTPDQTLRNGKKFSRHTQLKIIKKNDKYLW